MARTYKDKRDGGNTYQEYRSGKPCSRPNAPAHGRKDREKADAHSFADFGEHVGGVVGDVLMGDGSNIHDKGHDSAHHGPEEGRVERATHKAVPGTAKYIKGK